MALHLGPPSDRYVRDIDLEAMQIPEHGPRVKKCLYESIEMYAVNYHFL